MLIPKTFILLEELKPPAAEISTLCGSLPGRKRLTTIARFRTGFLADACEDLFYQMVRRLTEAGELSKETLFIDGTKLEVCANKYTFVWEKSVGKWEEKCLQRWKMQ